MNSTFGLLLVTGNLTHQEGYARQFAKDSRCKLIGLTDESDLPDERNILNRELADELDIPYIPSMAEALARDDVQFVSVCAEPERRGRIGARCARAGKHVYIDKPMTPYLDAADDIVDAVCSSEVMSQMFSNITLPWVRRAKTILDSGELGELIAIHADGLFAKGPGGTADLSKPRKQHYPARDFTFVDSKAEMYAIGVYALGLVRWISGREVENVYCHTANYFFEEHQRNGVEDFGYLALNLEDGLTATITGGRIGWSGHYAGGTNQVHLIGTRGSLMVDAFHPGIAICSDAPPWTPPEINPRDPMGFWSSTQREVNCLPKENWSSLPKPEDSKGDENHFLDCLEMNRESEMNVAQAAKITEILLAGYKSAATGEVVHLPLSREQKTPA